MPQHLKLRQPTMIQRLARVCAPIGSIAFVALAASACANGRATQASTTLGSGGTSTQIIANPDANTGVALNLANLALSAKTQVPLGINEAWSRLQAAYATLGFNLTNRDEQAHLIGNMSFKARRKVGDIELRKALECGGTGQGTPNAETYDITMGVRSRLIALSPESTELETYVEGVARNPLTNNTSVVKCITLGVFEKRIAEMVLTGMVPPVKK